jgi:hypothetical protein
MIAAILIWASQKKGDEGPKVTRTTSPQRAQPSVPEYLIVAWLCGNVHKLTIINVEYQEKC